MIVVALFFVAVFLVEFFNQPNTAKYQPKRKVERAKISLTLNSILFDCWDKTIVEFEEEYPGGEIDLNSKGLSSYRINIKITDNNNIAQLILMQNEAFISKRSKGGVNIRKLILYTARKEDQKKEYEYLVEFLTAASLKVANKGPGGGKAQYLVFNSDKSRKVSVELQKERQLPYINMLVDLIRENSE